MSAEAQRFIRAALAKSASQRPSAQELLHHAWIKPHLMRRTSLSQEQADVMERWAGGRRCSCSCSCSCTAHLRWLAGARQQAALPRPRLPWLPWCHTSG
jgi:hypothetical protein